MRRYTYNGEEGRYYPTLGLTPEPGKRYPLERNPGDGDWTPPDPEPKAAPEQVPAAPPTPEPTPQTPEQAAEAEQNQEGSDA